MGSCLLDYARDAPALNLISFNICLRGFKLTTQSCVIMASCTPGSTVPMQIKDTVHVWGILSRRQGFWNQWWIPKEGCERQAKPWHCLCDNGGCLDNPHSITRFSLSHSEQCYRWDFTCMNTGVPAASRIFLSCQSLGGQFCCLKSYPGLLYMTNVMSDKEARMPTHSHFQQL